MTQHITQQLKYPSRVSLPRGNCKSNPVPMAYLIQVTYHSLAGASDLTDMCKGTQHHDEEIDVKLKCSRFLVAL